VKLFLIDGSALAYRSHFAFITNPLKTSSGMETSAIFGFTSTVFRLIEKENPDLLAVITDSREKTFRHDRYESYKATREKMPDELANQLTHIETMMAALNIPYFGFPKYEADDVIGTIAKQASAENIEVFIVTGDKDFMQLLDKRTKIYSIKKGETEILDETASETKWGVKRHQVIDFMALMGDASDNVPGVPGVGEKTALKLISQFGSLDAIYADIGKVAPKKLQDALITHKEQAYMCRDLVTIHTDVPITVTLQDMARKAPNAEAAKKLFALFELNSLSEMLKKQMARSTPKADPDAPALAEIQSSTENNQLTICSTPSDIANLEKTLRNAGSVSFYLSEKDGIAFSVKRNEATAVGVENLHLLKALLEDPTVSKGTFDAKAAFGTLGKFNIRLEGIAFDPMIAAYLLDPESRQNKLEGLLQKYLQKTKHQLFGLESLGENAEHIFQLQALLQSQLEHQELEKLYREIELPLATTLAEMEIHGIALDKDHLAKMGDSVQLRLNALTKEIHALAGTEFNLNSPKQMGPILFEKLQVQNVATSKKIKKTKTGYSTDQETLEYYIDHPVIKSILEYRNLSKLQSTYILSLPQLMDPFTHRIHTSFNQTVAATGRLSSSDPNLQNIPIRTDLGRQIRKAFVPGTKGWKLMSADYSQIELRLLAHLSQDPTLIDTFQKNEDVHTRTASLIFNVPIDQVTSQIRGQAKSINFGIVYGMGSQRLAKETGISVAEAKAFIAAYFEKYSSIRKYLDSQVEFAKEHGFVRTLLGRKRLLPDIRSKNPMLYSNAERMATNTPIQGSAADMIKVAMVRIAHELKKEKLQSKMLLQVHDELVFEVEPSEIENLTAIVKKQMSGAMQLDIPLTVGVGVGNNWDEAH